MTSDKFAALFFLLAKSRMIVATVDMVQAWFELLKGYDDNNLEKAFYIFIKSPDHFPNVGKIISLIENKPSAREAAINSWGKGMKSIEKTYLDWGDSIGAKVAGSMGGSRIFKMMDMKEEMFYRNTFLKEYVILYEKQQKEKQMALPIEKIKMIGGE